MFRSAKDTSTLKRRSRQSIILLGILLSIYLGHRYYVIHRLTSSGVRLTHWVGWAVSFESRIRGYDAKDNDVPYTAGFPFCYPREANVTSEGVGTEFRDTHDLGHTLRSLGQVQVLYLFLESDYEGFFDGLGHNDRLTYLYSGLAHNFTDNALKKLVQFPNLQTIDLWPPAFKGSGLPALEDLERVELGESSVDESLISALLNCPKLREVSVVSNDIDISKAELLKSLPEIHEIQIFNSVTEQEFEWKKR